MICTYASGELWSAGGPWYGMFFFKLRLIPDAGVVIVTGIVTGDGELNRKLGWYSSHGFPHIKINAGTTSFETLSLFTSN
jgi:hypothetical protein